MLFTKKNFKIKIYITISLPFVLSVSETWSVTLREEHRLKVSENRVLKRIFGLEREEVAGGWKRLHNEELHNLYASPNIIRVKKKSRRIRWAGHVARMGELRNAYNILVGNTEGQRPLERSRRRWEDNIRLDLNPGGSWEFLSSTPCPDRLLVTPILLSSGYQGPFRWG
jgi:hypothetical protein